jgi:hypothetical protein
MFHIKETKTDSFASKVQGQYLQPKVLNSFPSFPCFVELANGINTLNEKQVLSDAQCW